MEACLKTFIWVVVVILCDLENSGNVLDFVTGCNIDFLNYHSCELICLNRPQRLEGPYPSLNSS